MRSIKPICANFSRTDESSVLYVEGVVVTHEFIAMKEEKLNFKIK